MMTFQFARIKIRIYLCFYFAPQFQRKDPDENGKITEVGFTELLLAYAGYPPKKKSRIMKRVKKKYGTQFYFLLAEKYSFKPPFYLLQIQGKRSRHHFDRLSSVLYFSQ
jgi:hypothetical protein